MHMQIVLASSFKHLHVCVVLQHMHIMLQYVCEGILAFSNRQSGDILMFDVLELG